MLDLARIGQTDAVLQTIDARYKNSKPMPTCGPRFNTSPLAATRGTPKLTSTRMGSKRYMRPKPTLIEGCVMAVCMDRESAKSDVCERVSRKTGKGLYIRRCLVVSPRLSTHGIWWATGDVWECYPISIVRENSRDLRPRMSLKLISAAGVSGTRRLTALVTTHARGSKAPYAERPTELKLVRVVYSTWVAC